MSHSNWPAVTAGNSTIVAAPVFARARTATAVLPAADAAKDRITRNFHDKDGRVIATLDGAGGLIQFVYNKAGPQDPGARLRQGGRFQPVGRGHAGAASGKRRTSSSDRRTDYVYDARGFLRYTLNGAAQPTKIGRDNAGRVIRTVAYPGSITAAATYTMAYVEAQVIAHGLDTSAAKRITRTVYDTAGRAAFGIDAAGGVTAFIYDAVGNVIKQTRYATVYATTERSQPCDDAELGGGPGRQCAQSDHRASSTTSSAASPIRSMPKITSPSSNTTGPGGSPRTYAMPAPIRSSDGVTKASLAAQIGTLPASAVVTSYAYDADGLLSETVDGTGAVTRYAYDSLGQLTDTTVAYGTADATTLHRAYDAVGRVLSETRAYGTGIAATTAFAYDALGNRQRRHRRPRPRHDPDLRHRRPSAHRRRFRSTRPRPTTSSPPTPITRSAMSAWSPTPAATAPSTIMTGSAG